MDTSLFTVDQQHTDIYGTCEMDGRTTGNGATQHCLLLSPSTTHTTRGRLGRVCAVHSPRLPKAQAAFRLSLLAPLFVFSRLSFPTMLVFFFTILFFCVSLWARINIQRPQVVFSTVWQRTQPCYWTPPTPAGLAFCRNASLPPGCLYCAREKCVEASTFFLFATIRPSAL